MKILLATDGSEYAENAARFLTRMQWSSDDAITVFHAIYAVPFGEDDAFHFNTLKSIKKSIAPRIMDSTLAVLRPVHANISVEIDEFAPSQCTPDQCIIDAAQLADADLIVLGARGIKGIGSFLIGSVTKSVAIHSPKPVLIVKPAAHSPSAAMRILFATDDSDPSLAAAALLSSLSFAGNAELAIVNVVAHAFSDVPEKFLAGIDEQGKEVIAKTRVQEQERSEAVIEQAGKQLRKRFKNVLTFSKAGDPSTEILKTAEAMEADLIVLGSRGLRGIKGMLGSVSRNVLAHAKCSVLIGKAPHA